MGFRYLSLPPEIRNKIMEYALMPGNVHPRLPIPSPLKDPIQTPSQPMRSFFWALLALFFAFMGKTLFVEKSDKPTFRANLTPMKALPGRPRSLPGFQLLATCKQTCEEGKELYYEKNVFHLPSGPIGNTTRWLDTLQPKHRSMIKSVCIHLSLADLSPRTMDDVDRESIVAPYSIPALRDLRAVKDIVRHLAVEIWKPKVEYLMKWRTLDRIVLETGFRRFEYKVNKQPWSSNRGVEVVYLLMRKDVEEELREMVNALGWEDARCRLLWWLERKEKGQT